MYSSSLKGRVILITGASSGIGKGIAMHFARLGCRLSITGRNANNLEKVAAECKNAGLSEDQVLAIKGDINNEEDREAIVKTTVESFGEINVLVNNAGLGYNKELISITPQMFDEIFHTNLRSLVFFTQLVLPYLIKSIGNVVNNSSFISKRIMPGTVVYSMTKASLDMFTQMLALEMAPRGVRVNSVNPGVTVSSGARRSYSRYQDEDKYQEFLKMQALLHPLGRVAQPEDCAARQTGQLLFVDGGRNCASTSKI